MGAELARTNTLELPAPAGEVVSVQDPSDLQAYLEALPTRLLADVVVAGELSNTVVADHVSGPLLLFRDGRVLDEEVSGDRLCMRISASTSLDAVIWRSIELGFPGLELLSGIPGTVGAGVVQNIAAYGQHLSDVFSSARAVDRSTGDIVHLTRDDLAFSYRSSRLKAGRSYCPDMVLLEVTLDLHRGAPAPLRYDDLRRRHAVAGRSDDDLHARRASVLDVRQRKGMVVGGDNWTPSAGSFFVGPVVGPQKALHIAQSIRGTEFADSFLSWYQPDRESVRLPAALAIRAAGFMNGDRWGSVGLSPHHILALTNFGGATAGEVLALADHVRSEVRRMLGVELHPEVKVLGEPTAVDWDHHVMHHGFRPGSGEPTWARDMGRPS